MRLSHARVNAAALPVEARITAGGVARYFSKNFRQEKKPPSVAHPSLSKFGGSLR